MTQSFVKKDEPTQNVHPEYSLLHTPRDQKLPGLVLIHLVPYIYQNFKVLQKELLDKYKTSGSGGRLRVKPPCVGKIRVETYPNGTKKITLLFDEPTARIFPFSLMPTFNVITDKISQGCRFIFSYNRQTGYVSLKGRIISSSSSSPIESDRASKIRQFVSEAKKKMLCNESKEVMEDDNMEIREYQKAQSHNKRSDNREILSDDEIRAKIIALYREKPSWRLSEINSRIDQPSNVIKRILEETCTYNNGFYEQI